MHGGRGIAAAVAAMVLLALAPVGASGEPLEPPDPAGFCPRELKPCGEPVIIGKAEWKTGPVLASGYSSGFGPCLNYTHRGGSSGTCGADRMLRRKGDLFITGLSFSSKYEGSPPYTEVSGVMRPDVAYVRVRYRTNGNPRVLDAFTADISGRVQSKLKASFPFRVFEVSVTGCVPWSHFRATGYDATGARLETVRIPQFRGSCRNRKPGTGGAVTFGRAVPFR